MTLKRVQPLYSLHLLRQPHQNYDMRLVKLTYLTYIADAFLAKLNIADVLP